MPTVPVETEVSPGKTIVLSVIDETIGQLQRKELPNALRGINTAANRIKLLLEKEGFNPNDFIMAGTIGDIDMRLPSEDTLEKAKFGDLEAKMGLDESSPYFEKFQQEERRILAEYRKNKKNVFQYEATANGTEESRNLFRAEADRIGLQTSSPNEVWIGDGGMGVLARVYRTLHNTIKKNTGRDGLLIAPEVCFTMAANSAASNGLNVEYVKTSDTEGQQINGEALSRYFKETKKIPDVMLLTPAENPTAKSYEPENLRQAITAMQEKNPDAVFIFDMAYMSMIPQKRAQEIMQVINETGAVKQAIFVFSQSKRLAEPRLRIGAAIIPHNGKLQKAFQADTIQNYSSYSWKSDVWFQTLSQTISQETLDSFYLLLRTRQYALLEVLKDLDPQHKYFVHLDSLSIPGFHETGDNTVEQDNPMYLYIELQEGIDALADVAKDLGIFGVPSNVFGDGKSNHMRFSLGVVSLEQILKRSPRTMERLRNML